MSDQASFMLGRGTTISSYRVEALIGRGGMGAVYRASEEGLGRKVALKVITPELAQDERFRERFLRESRIAASLDHPHVVPIYQAGEEEGLVFLAMRYVEGTDLAQLLASEGALEPRRALALLSQVAEALDAAHGKGLVHRDVKPSNVLIAQAAGSEHCYLADFGLSRRTGSVSGTSPEGEVVGTLEYVAPEQITGEPLDERSDVYSLGCVLYECLTGQAPFPRATDVALLWAHVHQEATPPSEVRPELPHELDAVLARALAKQPEHRYRSASELMDAALGSPGGALLEREELSRPRVPRPASSFVGRTHELSEILGRLAGGARLLTLTGPGGSGKTRLAIEVAATVASPKDGIFWIALASLRDPGLVSQTITQALSARGDLAEHIADSEMLVLLDNFEHLIDAAPELPSLLERCPNLTLLVTSRERLRVQGELEYPVLALAEAEAVELFCARARMGANPTVVELCRRLDNLPLALELAAARTSALSPRQMLERLSGRLDMFKGGRDADPRQQTLRATMEWSHELLASDERQLFARLAVFRGGCTLEAAEKVCEARLDTLQSLVDKNLLHHTGERFSMLETIREYATERLEASGDADELRRRHAEHFLALAEEAEPSLRAVAAGEWPDRLDRDRDNLRAALDWLKSSGEGELVLRLAGALRGYWYMRAPAEGWRRLESALTMDTRPTAARARALSAAASLSREVVGDDATMRLLAEEALALHRSLGDAWGVAYSRFLLGTPFGSTDVDLATAEQHFDESTRLFRDLGDEHYALLATSNFAEQCYDLGDRERARALYEGVLARARATSNKRVEAISMAALAVCAIDEGQPEDALSLLSESLRIRRDVGDLIGLCADLRRSSLALAVAGRAGAAARLLSSSEALREQLGTSLQPDSARMDEQTLAIVHAQLDKAAFANAWAQGRALKVEEAIALSLDSGE